MSCTSDTRRLLDAYAKVGRHLTTVTDTYNKSVGSLEGRVLPQLRRLEDLGAKSEKELPAVHGIDSAARTMIVPELPADDSC